MPSLLNILVIEESEDDMHLVLRELKNSGYTLYYERVETDEAMRAALTHISWDIIIADYMLPGFSTLDALTLLQEHELDIPFIVVSGTVGEEFAVAAMKAGAHDYLMKDNLRRLVPAIEREIRDTEVRREHQRVELALRESEQRFRAMIEHITDCIALLDIEGSVLYVSPAIITLFGLSPDRCIGSRVFDRIYADDRGYAEAIFATLCESPGTTITIEIRYQHRDGWYRWIEATGSNWLNHSSIRAIVVNFRDITERKNVSDILRRSEERFARAFHASPVPIAISRLCDGCLLHVNGSFLELVNYSLEQVMGRTSIELGFWGTVEERAAIIEALQQGQPVRGINLQFRPATGAIRNLLAWIELIELEGETCTLTMLHDITERRCAENRQSTRMAVTRILSEAATIDEAMPNVLQTICQGFNWQSGEMWSIDANNTLLRCAYTWHVPALDGSDFATLTPALTFSTEHDLPGQVWAQGSPVSVADIATLPDFQRAAAARQAGLRSAIASPVRIGADFDGVMCFFSQHTSPYDAALLETITDIGCQVSQFLHRKRTETALVMERSSLKQRVGEATLELSRMNAELARAVRVKDEFLATMSHELRTPLNAILGMTEALQDEVYGPTNDRQCRALGTIESSGRHLLALINDILDISKIEAGKVELQFDAVPVESVCKACLQFIHQQALQKRIHISFDIEHAPATFMADVRRLKQILINLLSNAVKFTPEGGKVGLHVTNGVECESIHFTVWDTGIGISPSYHPCLFKPFVQLDSSLSKAHQGTGLGLALVARLTEMHGGSVTLQSQEGQGSSFIISLPVRHDLNYAAQFTSDAEPWRQSEQNTTGQAILVVEDNEATLQVLGDYLEQQGYSVVMARNGAEAIQQVSAEHPELILMDIQMPGMDGLEATRRIREHSHFATIPIIAITALTMPGDRERCLEAGANEYISKPVSLKTLVRTVQTQLTSVQHHHHSV